MIQKHRNHFFLLKTTLGKVYPTVYIYCFSEEGHINKVNRIIKNKRLLDEGDIDSIHMSSLQK